MSLAIKSRSMVMRRGMAGDPGLGGFIKSIGKVAGGFLAGGPIGAAAGLVSSFTGGGRPQAMPGGVALPTPQQFTPQQFGPSGWGVSSGGSGGTQVTTPWGTIGFGGSGGFNFGPGTTGPSAGALVCAPGMKGVRLNKTGYHLKSGQYVPPGTRCVRVRRRNPLNPRALSRAMSRVVSFKKAAKAASRISIRGGCGCK